MTAFDSRDLTRLAAEAQSVEVVRDYVGRYRRLLDHRVRRVVDSLAVEDLDIALDAVLSLKASSAMVGACETTELAQQLKELLRAGDLPGARATASLLPQVTRRLDVLLGEFLEDEGALHAALESQAGSTQPSPCDSRRRAPCG